MRHHPTGSMSPTLHVKGTNIVGHEHQIQQPTSKLGIRTKPFGAKHNCLFSFDHLVLHWDILCFAFGVQGRRPTCRSSGSTGPPTSNPFSSEFPAASEVISTTENPTKTKNPRPISGRTSFGPMHQALQVEVMRRDKGIQPQ